MPKKTKRQKVLADRRHSISLPSISLDEKRPESPQTPTFQFQSLTTKVQTRNGEGISELAAIQRDLVKTIVLATLAVGIELLVYWRFFR